MTMYPFNRRMGQTLQSDADGVAVDHAFLAHFQIPAAAAAAADTDGVLAATALAAGVTTEVTAGITSPAAPRALSVTGNQATAAGDVVIEGTNYAGEAITETIVAAGATTANGTKAFKTITKITLPAQGGAGDTISVGWNEKLGLPFRLARNTVLETYHNNVREGTAPTVTVDAAAMENNTIDLSTALDGSVVDVYLMV